MRSLCYVILDITATLKKSYRSHFNTCLDITYLIGCFGECLTSSLSLSNWAIFLCIHLETTALAPKLFLYSKNQGSVFEMKLTAASFPAVLCGVQRLKWCRFSTSFVSLQFSFSSMPLAPRAQHESAMWHIWHNQALMMIQSWLKICNLT